MANLSQKIVSIRDNNELRQRKDKSNLFLAGENARILLHSPDITLKGKNQKTFQKALLKNIKYQLLRHGINWPISAARGRCYVDIPNNADIEQAVAVLQRVSGISSLATTLWLHPSRIVKQNGELNWDAIATAFVKLANSCFRTNASFAIQINRTDKKLPVTSMEMATRLGQIVRDATAWDRVKLKQPDQKFYIDAYPDGLYLYAEKIKGIGGLPVGTGGRVLSLLSGGIDSPVAAFHLAKRGCMVDMFHMTASHVHDIDTEKSVIVRLARQLSQYTLRSTLFMAPYTYFDLALKGQHSGYELVLFRRFLMRTAEALAGEISAQALISGDSLGQVASQTLENLVTASRAVSIPIMRPLIGSNKDEIIDQARRIGTYVISIEPYKDCCALIAKNPKTRSFDQHMTELESTLLDDYQQLIRKTLADMMIFKFECGELISDSDN